MLLLAASYYFYASWKVEYLALIVLSTIVDFYFAQQIAKSENEFKRKLYLGLSLSINLGLLFFFKYTGFLFQSVNDFFGVCALDFELPLFKILLPVGISFYTFQTLSYTIDVYRREIVPEKNIGKFALFVSYFPQLVAGPIERSSSLIPQVKRENIYNYDNLKSGGKIVLWGFFKKLVIADNISLIVEPVYSNPTAYGGMELVLVPIFFAFQIYCDFSGYSDIAIGVSKMFGIDLMDNFKRPYSAYNIVDFWKRWHISLSSWFRDYLYIPLGGNRVGKWKRFVNVFLVFLISGIWHGANWTFLAWGAIHGVYVLLFELFKKIGGTQWVPKGVVSQIFTFFFVCVAWVFFRADSLGNAKDVLVGMMHKWSMHGYQNLGYLSEVAYVVLFILFMQLVHVFMKDRRVDELFHSRHFLIRWAFYYSLVLFIILFGNFNSSEFIYFQL
jgi:D-alanyl-lipoteichoic acid acyltransferase DltB (MBOAT superfamily)